MPQSQNLTKVAVFAPGREFLLPYIQRELDGCHELLFSSGENSEVVADYHIAIVEQGMSSPQGYETVLECPNIVGTGMTGIPMEIAVAVAGGTYYHIAGNTARLSTVHAVDVAHAVRLAVGHSGRYTVTDGQNPTYEEFAEALAYRINQRRIYTLREPWCRFLMRKSLRHLVTTDNCAEGEDFACSFDFNPTPVTEYLRTHDYNDESL